MSALTWLHVSDWHQRGSDFDRRVVRDAMMRDIHRRTNISPDLELIDFIFVTGDIAFSGKSEEYEAAVEHFFRPLLKSCGVKRNAGWDRLFVVPGNHDMDRDIIDGLPPDLKQGFDNASALKNALSETWKLSAILRPFQGYEGFVNKYWPRRLAESRTAPAYSYLTRVNKDNKTVAIIGLNSALFSGRNRVPSGDVHDYGYLMMGEPQVYDRIDELDRNASSRFDVVICLMHHPLSWLMEFDRNVIDERLHRKCHFILHGHQHLPRVNVLQSTLGDVVIIPGGASYDRRLPDDPRYTNAFNFVHLNFDSGQGVIYLRRWSEVQGAWIADDDVYQDGRFSFFIPKSPEFHHPVRRIARDELIKRYRPQLQKRFFEQLDISVKQTLQDFSGTKLVRHEAVFKAHIAAGDPEELSLETFGSERVTKKAQKLNLKPYTLNYFKINGKDVLLKENKRVPALYRTSLEGSPTTIEYSYGLYLMPDDVYWMRLRRFTMKFKFRFQRDKSLEYNLMPTGGLPATEIKRDGPFEYDLMEINDLCFPDQGYLIRWYQDERQGKKPRQIAKSKESRAEKKAPKPSTG